MSPRLLRPRAAGGFDPKNISSLIGWWDFADSATLFADNTATTLAGADAGVAVAKDKSANAYNLTQPTENNRPLRKTAVTNSRDVLRFDTNDSLIIPNLPLPSWTAYSIFCVAKPAGTGIYGLVDYTRGLRFGTFLNSGTFSAAHVGTQATRGTASTNVFYLFQAEWSGTAVRAAINNSFGSSAATTAVMGSVSGATGLIGALHDGFFLNGDIGEVVIYNRQLTSTETASVAEYLRKKWALY